MDNDAISMMNKDTIDMEYFTTHIQFVKTFGHGVPTEMIPTRINQKEIINAMKQCLEEGEDRILEILGVEVNHDVLY
jgi:hypothetical protein